MGTTTSEVLFSGFDWGAFIEIILVLGVPALVLLGFGVWAMRKRSGGAVQAVDIALTALGVILSVFTLAAIALGVPIEVISESTVIEGVP